MKFKYWNNKQVARSELLLEVEADNIVEADTKLEEKTGFKAVKCPWIGCEIVKNELSVGTP